MAKWIEGQEEFASSAIYLLDKHPMTTPDSKVQGANMGPIWGRQDPGGPHVGPMNLWTFLTRIISHALN